MHSRDVSPLQNSGNTLAASNVAAGPNYYCVLRAALCRRFEHLHQTVLESEYRYAPQHVMERYPVYALVAPISSGMVHAFRDERNHARANGVQAFATAALRAHARGARVSLDFGSNQTITRLWLAKRRW